MGVTIHRLANGLTVYISPDRSEPMVSAHIVVRAGSRTDPPELRAISTAVLIAGFARSVSARSTGTKILLYMTAPLVSLQGCNHDMFSCAR